MENIGQMYVREQTLKQREYKMYTETDVGHDKKKLRVLRKGRGRKGSIKIK